MDGTVEGRTEARLSRRFRTLYGRRALLIITILRPNTG
jgi:hypothetical protein